MKIGNCNRLDFKESDHKTAVITIDGRKLLDIIREIELPYAEEEGRLAKKEGVAEEDEDYSDLAGAYGHLSAKVLFDNLKTGISDCGSSHDERVYLFCCGDCGEIFCWTVSMKVRMDEHYVYWYDFKHEHRNWEYNLSYTFEKTAYEAALRKLGDLAKGQYITKSKPNRLRNLSICPLTPDPPEILRLKEEIRQFLREVDFQNDCIYAAWFTFDYNDVTYRMDNYALATDPARMWKAEGEITERLVQFGASNVLFWDRED